MMRPRVTKHAVGQADAASCNLAAYIRCPVSTSWYCVAKIGECQNEVPLSITTYCKDRAKFKITLSWRKIGDFPATAGGIKYTSGAIDDFMMCQTIYADSNKMFFGVTKNCSFLPWQWGDFVRWEHYNFMAPTYHKSHRKNTPKRSTGGKAGIFRAPLG